MEIAKETNAIEAAYDEVYDALEHLKLIERQRQEAQEQMRQAVEALGLAAAKADDNQRLKLIQFLYQYKALIKPTLIAQAFNLPVARVSLLAKVGLLCSRCGEPMEHPASNRIQMCKACSAVLREEEIERSKVKAQIEEQKEARREAARQARLRELHTMPYRDYLLTPEWQATRLDALRRAWYHCQVCNQKGKLNVHHRTYERRGYEERGDLIVLCTDCHTLYHQQGKLPPDPA